MKIKKLTLTYIVEDISKIDMNFETNIDTHRAWLHHTNCITLQPRNSGHQYLPMGININMNQNVVNNDDSGGGGDGDDYSVLSSQPNHNSRMGGINKSLRSSIGGSSVFSELRSMTTSVTSTTASFSRTSKCSGDFCSYYEDEEWHHMKMSDEIGGTFHREVKRAIGRHRTGKCVSVYVFLFVMMMMINIMLILYFVIIIILIYRW